MSTQIRKYLRSLRKLPSQVHPLAQVQRPLPDFLSCLQPPTYTSPPFLHNFHRPQPYLLPQTKLPSQEDPLAHTYFPFPWNLPFLYYPRQRSPFANNSSPNPCLIDFTNVPSQNYLSETFCTPFPSFFPFFHSPSQDNPDTLSSCFPCPFFYPFYHWPWYIVPFSIMIAPDPFFLPSRNCPLQQCLLGTYQNPSPCFRPSPCQVCSHPPIQNLPEQCQTIVFFTSGVLKIMQFLYFFIQRCSSFSIFSPNRSQTSFASFNRSLWLMSGVGGQGRAGTGKASTSISGTLISSYQEATDSSFYACTNSNSKIFRPVDKGDGGSRSFSTLECLLSVLGAQLRRVWSVDELRTCLTMIPLLLRDFG